jgi:hypothetical protein
LLDVHGVKVGGGTMRGHDFDMELVYDGETLRVTGTITPGCEATRLDPPEPAEIEDFQAFREDGTEIEDTYAIYTALEDEIMEKVSDDVASDMADAAEARDDARRDR